MVMFSSVNKEFCVQNAFKIGIPDGLLRLNGCVLPKCDYRDLSGSPPRRFRINSPPRCFLARLSTFNRSQYVIHHHSIQLQAVKSTLSIKSNIRGISLEIQCLPICWNSQRCFKSSILV